MSTVCNDMLHWMDKQKLKKEQKDIKSAICLLSISIYGIKRKVWSTCNKMYTIQTQSKSQTLYLLWHIKKTRLFYHIIVSILCLMQSSALIQPSQLHLHPHHVTDMLLLWRNNFSHRNNKRNSAPCNKFREESFLQYLLNKAALVLQTSALLISMFHITKWSSTQFL